jgi:hypothetical protein
MRIIGIFSSTFGSDNGGAPLPNSLKETLAAEPFSHLSAKIFCILSESDEISGPQARRPLDIDANFNHWNSVC